MYIQEQPTHRVSEKVIWKASVILKIRHKLGKNLEFSQGKHHLKYL